MARLSLMSDISAAVGQRPPVMSTANTSDSMTQFMLGAQVGYSYVSSLPRGGAVLSSEFLLFQPFRFVISIRIELQCCKNAY